MDRAADAEAEGGRRPRDFQGRRRRDLHADPEERAAFQEAAQPVWAWYEENFGRDWIDAAQSAVADCEAQVEAAFTNASQ